MAGAVQTLATMAGDAYIHPMVYLVRTSSILKDWEKRVSLRAASLDGHGPYINPHFSLIG